ncbi:MAG: hypothetical protein LC135_11475 [Phycisphaerae bacterium]|nr:hypothetical protein [Phycisphaerae bacterium]MCZ2400468.1 hypothetical protein [Phycisphaerae bacterium]NUQ50257.1 hypothetical protein [Phycisphaerae bacterium]
MNPGMDFTATEIDEHEHEHAEGIASEFLFECRQTIAARYFEVAERLDVRHLWTREGVSTFRVNWWKSDPLTGERWIYRSAFVAVEAKLDGMIVLDQTRQKAA